MRADSLLSALAALAALAACERDVLAPSATPRCGDGVPVESEVCLRSSAVDIPYTYNFMRHADADADGIDEFVAMGYGFQTCGVIFFTLPTATDPPELYTYYEFVDTNLYHPVLADLDGDGRTDLLSAALFWYFSGDIQIAETRVQYWHNIGDFKFELADYTFASPDFFPTLAAGDVNGDGIQDAVVIGWDEVGFVWAHRRDSGELPSGHNFDLKPLHLIAHPVLAAADHNGDPYADFVLTDGTGRAWWLIGGPDYTLTVLDPAGSPALAPGPGSLYARDFDGDGLVDLAAVRINAADDSRPTDTISLARGRPDGRFEPLATFETATRLTYADLEFFPSIPLAHLGFFDLDATGELALVYAHHQRPELVIHPHVARTRGAEPVIIPLDFPAMSLFVDDLDDDGDDSIYVAISDLQPIEPTPAEPDGVLEHHFLVQFTQDP